MFCSSGVDATTEHVDHINLDPGHYSRKDAFLPENYYFPVSQKHISFAEVTRNSDKTNMCFVLKSKFDILISCSFYVPTEDNLIRTDRHSDKKSS